ncbi:MAG: DUF1559 domain-containing protein [Planctomycetota bacterium]|nr:DUF1559 domain-containing protein [Planctomycetota bacterium]
MFLKKWTTCGSTRCSTIACFSFALTLAACGDWNQAQAQEKAKQDPAGIQSPAILKLAPESCQFLYAWHPTQGEVAEGNATKQLLKEPEVQVFLQQLRTAAGNMVKMGVAQESLANQELGKDLFDRLLEILENRSGLLFVEKLKLDPESGISAIEGGMAMDIGKDARLMASFSRLLLQGGVQAQPVQVSGKPFLAIQTNEMLPGGPLLVGLADDYLLAGFGKESINGMLKRLEKDQPPEWLTRIYRDSHVPHPTSIGYVNARSMLDQLAVNLGPQVPTVFRGLGLDAVTTVDAITGFDDTGLMTRMSMNVTSKPRGLLSLLDSRPLNPIQMNRIPEDALFATSMAVDSAKIIQLIREFSLEFETGQKEMMDSLFAAFQGEFEVDLENDLIGQMGPTLTLFNGMGDGMFTGLVLSIELKKPETFRAAHDKLMDSIGEMSRGQGSALKKARIGDHTVYTFAGSFDGVPLPMEPSWSVADNRLLISLFPGVLNPYLSPNPRDSYLAIEKLINQPEDDGDLLAFAYIDEKQQFGMMYSYAQMMKSFGSMMADELGGNVGPGNPAGVLSNIRLPSARSIYRHLGSSRAMLRRSGKGLEMVWHQTVPTPNLVATTPVGVALLLPAVQSARVAARRTQSANNLKMQGLALHNYHDVYRGFPAAYSTNEAGKPLLSWRVHILPFVEQNALYEQFHLDEPWDSEHNLKLLEKMPEIYRSPQSNAPPGMTSYRAVGGEGAAFIAPREDGRDSPFKGNRMRNFLDGTSNTVLLVEASDKMAVPWTKPNVLPIKNINVMSVAPLFGFYRDGTNFLLADGSVMFLSNKITADSLKKWLTIAGGEINDWPE